MNNIPILFYISGLFSGGGVVSLIYDSDVFFSSGIILLGVGFFLWGQKELLDLEPTKEEINYDE